MRRVGSWLAGKIMFEPCQIKMYVASQLDTAATSTENPLNPSSSSPTPTPFLTFLALTYGEYPSLLLVYLLTRYQGVDGLVDIVQRAAVALCRKLS